jgi:TetR/AcrR family transcriptional repressor of nem operon
MVRPRQFDESEALEQALQLFWRFGYEATSLEQLLAATGLSKSSLYQAFGSKAELFAAALKSYQDAQASDIANRLAADPDPHRAIGQLLHAFIRPPDDQKAWGCLTCNTAVELAPHDPEIAKLVARHHRRLEGLFAKSLARGQELGMVDASLNPRATASFLVAALSGLQVLARAGADRQRINAAAKGVLSALGDG